MKNYVIVVLFIVLTACSSNRSEKWTKQELGSNEKLFLNEDDFVRIRSNIDQYEWAANLYIKLKQTAIDSVIHYPSDQPDEWRIGFRTRELAIYYRLSGDTTVLNEIHDALIYAYNLNDIEKPLFTKGKNMFGYWSWGMFRMGYLAAWDLVKTQPLFADLIPLMEWRLDEIINRGFEFNDAITRLGNTQFWGITNLGVAGFLRDNKNAIDTALNGQHGYKASLLRYRDKTFWPEPLKYDLGYVASAMHMLAEAAELNNIEDLYNYTAANGASFKGMMDGFASLMLSDGALPASGDGTAYISVVNDTAYNKTPYFFIDEQRGFRTKFKLDLVYKTFKDPVYAWMLAKNSKRDNWDHNFWSWTAFTNGIELGEQKAPSAASVVYPEFGVALLRADTTENYWGSNSLSAVLRNGASLQFHSHNQHFALEVNAFKKLLYFDNFLSWDYLAPRKSRSFRNSTPFSGKLIAHNSVTIDFKEPDNSVIKLGRKIPEIPGVEYSDIITSGQMQILTASGSIYKGVEQIRTIGVTSDYVLDIFECASKEKHNYDYSLHSFGKLFFENELSFNPYNNLNKEYGLAEIDKAATKGNNVWLLNTQKSFSDSAFEATFLDSDSIGMHIIVAGEANTQLLKTEVPLYVSGDGWDNILPEGLPERKPLLIVRRNTNTTRFITLHVPFKNKVPQYILKVDEDKITIICGEYMDEYFINEQRFNRINE